MDELRFCEDCKWCSDNFFKKWFRQKKWAKCMHPRCFAAQVSRTDMSLADFCLTLREQDWGCGKDGKYYEKKIK